MVPKLGEGIIEKILKKKNKTNIARVKALDLEGNELTDVRGFIIKDRYPEEIEYKDSDHQIESETYICQL